MSDREFVSGVRVGDVLAGKYRVDRLLGEGGMGVVVAAHHLQLETRVAIKLLASSMIHSEEGVARFEREARAAVRIASPHVARVLDVGKLDGGSPYMVMEFLEGEDLSTRLRTQGPLSVFEAVELLLQACEAIAEAHTLGIVHRDLKPANLFCTQRPDGLPCVKVLDFGISKVTSVGGSTPEVAMTRTSALMGTPLYMSPEQMTSSRTVDSRTDIWALGVILHEVLSGAAPFGGDTLPEVCLRIATSPPPRLRSLRSDIPHEIEAAVLKCLEKDRERRFRSVAEFAMALAPFGPDRARASIDRIVRTFQRADARSTLLAPDTHSASSRPPSKVVETLGALGYTDPHRAPRRRFVKVAGGLVVVALAGTLLFLVTGRSGHETPASLPAAALQLPGATAPAVAATVVEAPVVEPQAPARPSTPSVAAIAARDDSASASPVERDLTASTEPSPRARPNVARTAPRVRPSSPAPSATGAAPPGSAARPAPSAPPPTPKSDPFSVLKPM